FKTSSALRWHSRGHFGQAHMKSHPMPEEVKAEASEPKPQIYTVQIIEAPATGDHSYMCPGAVFPATQHIIIQASEAQGYGGFGLQSVTIPQPKQVAESTDTDVKLESGDGSNSKKRYKCWECSAEFSIPSHLTRHAKNKHSVDRPYQCPDCPAAFRRPSDLKRHIRNHTGQNPYLCPQCPAAFTAMSSLKKEKHTILNPFKMNKEHGAPWTPKKTLESTTGEENASTLRSNKSSKQLFRDFLQFKGLPTDFENFSVPQLDKMLCRFFAEVRTHKGTFYKTNSLRSIRCGLSRYLRSLHGSDDRDILHGHEFAVSRSVFKSVLKENRKIGMDEVVHHGEISQADLKKLYESPYFDPNTPLGLANRVQFEVRLYFCFDSAAMLTMTTSALSIGLDAQSGHKCVFLNPDDAGKTNRQSRSPGAVMVGNGTDNCPVKCFEKYLSHLHPQCEYLWQRPVTSKVLAADKSWYSAVRIGRNTLAKFMSRLSLSCRLSKKYTNHSIRCLRSSLSQKMPSLADILCLQDKHEGDAPTRSDQMTFTTSIPVLTISNLSTQPVSCQFLQVLSSDSSVQSAQVQLHSLVPGLTLATTPATNPAATPIIVPASVPATMPAGTTTPSVESVSTPSAIMPAAVTSSTTSPGVTPASLFATAPAIIPATMSSSSSATLPGGIPAISFAITPASIPTTASASSSVTLPGIMSATSFATTPATIPTTASVISPTTLPGVIPTSSFSATPGIPSATTAVPAIACAKVGVTLPASIDAKTAANTAPTTPATTLTVRSAITPTAVIPAAIPTAAPATAHAATPATAHAAMPANALAPIPAMPALPVTTTASILSALLTTTPAVQLQSATPGKQPPTGRSWRRKSCWTKKRTTLRGIRKSSRGASSVKRLAQGSATSSCLQKSLPSTTISDGAQNAHPLEVSDTSHSLPPTDSQVAADANTGPSTAAQRCSQPRKNDYKFNEKAPGISALKQLLSESAESSIRFSGDVLAHWKKIGLDLGAETDEEIAKILMESYLDAQYINSVSGSPVIVSIEQGDPDNSDISSEELPSKRAKVDEAQPQIHLLRIKSETSDDVQLLSCVANSDEVAEDHGGMYVGVGLSNKLEPPEDSKNNVDIFSLLSNTGELNSQTVAADFSLDDGGRPFISVVRAPFASIVNVGGQCGREPSADSLHTVQPSVTVSESKVKRYTLFDTASRCSGQMSWLEERMDVPDLSVYAQVPGGTSSLPDQIENSTTGRKTHTPADSGKILSQIANASFTGVTIYTTQPSSPSQRSQRKEAPLPRANENSQEKGKNVLLNESVGESFKGKGGLGGHASNVLPTAASFVCGECSKSFTRPGHLLSHMQAHGPRN
ncbi:hypothetical protein BaRGS_00033412, partial [Batillaria attramentaria]